MMAALPQQLPPVSREQAFLETYFQCLSQLAFDKAKESCEKETSTHKLTNHTLWGQMLNGLIQLALAEKTYASLMFLGLKWFGRKDSLRSSYGSLLQELRKIEEAPSKYEGSRTDKNLDKILSHLCGQLGHFLTARAKMMDFYEQMATLGSANNKMLNSEDLCIVVSDISSSQQKNFHHPILSPLKSAFTLECDIVIHLLKAQLHMSNWRFLETLLHLNDAQSKLTSLSTMAPMKESKKLGFGSKHPPLPALHQWLNKFKGHLVSKFGLYFYEVLSKQAPPGEMKNLLSKASFDFYGKMVTFQKKSDAVSLCLIFDSNELEDFQKGSGYHHPQKSTDLPTGVDSYPAIFLYPPDKPDKHWPNVISIISDKFSVAENVVYDKPFYFCDERLPATYFMMAVEPRITFVLIFEAKKSEKDSHVNNFMNDMTTQMRCSKLYAALRPGTKG